MVLVGFPVACFVVDLGHVVALAGYLEAYFVAGLDHVEVLAGYPVALPVVVGLDHEATLAGCLVVCRCLLYFVAGHVGH